MYRKRLGTGFIAALQVFILALLAISPAHAQLDEASSTSNISHEQVSAFLMRPFESLENEPWRIELPFLPVASTAGSDITIPISAFGKVSLTMLTPSDGKVWLDGGAIRAELYPGPPRTANVLIELAANGSVAARVMPIFVGELKPGVIWLDGQHVAKEGDTFVSQKSLPTGSKVASAEVFGSVKSDSGISLLNAADVFDEINIHASSSQLQGPGTKALLLPCLTTAGTSTGANITWSTPPSAGTITTTLDYQQSVQPGMVSLYRLVLRARGYIAAAANQVVINASGALTCGAILGGSQSTTVGGMTVGGTLAGVAGLTFEANRVSVDVRDVSLRVDGIDVIIGAERLNNGSWRNLSSVAKVTPSYTMPTISVAGADFSLRAGVAAEASGTVKLPFTPTAASFKLAQILAGSGIYAKFSAPFDFRAPNYTGPEFGIEHRALIRALDFGGWAAKIVGLPSAPLIELDERIRPVVLSPRVISLTASALNNGLTNITGRYEKALLFPLFSPRVQAFTSTSPTAYLSAGPNLGVTNGVFSGSASATGATGVAVRVFGNDPLSSRYPYASAITPIPGACNGQLSSNASPVVGNLGMSLAVGISPACPGATASSPVAWIVPTINSSGSQALLSVAANPTSATRTATVIIAGRSYLVTQQPGVTTSCTVTNISPNTASVAAAGADVAFAITLSANNCPVPSPIFSVTWASNQLLYNGTLTVRVAPNSSPSSRSAVVTVGAKTISITQASAVASSCSVTAMQSSIEALPGGSNHGVPYSTNQINCLPQISGTQSWITAAPRTDLVVLDFAANTTGVVRTTNLTVGGRNLFVQQPPLTQPQLFSLLTTIRPANGGYTTQSPSNQALAPGTLVSITAIANGGFQFTSAILVNSLGNQNFASRGFSLNTNASAANLFVDFATCSYAAPSGITIPAANAATPVSVTSNPNCNPAATTTTGWLSTYLNSANQIVVVAQTNPSTTTRSGSIQLINGPAVTVTQLAGTASSAPTLVSATPATLVVSNLPQVVTLTGTAFNSALFHAGFGVPSNAATSYGSLQIVSDTEARLTLSSNAQTQFGTLGFAVRAIGTTVLPNTPSATVQLRNPVPAGLTITGACRRSLNCGSNGSADAVISTSNESLMRTSSVPNSLPGSRFYLRAPGASAWTQMISPLYTLGGGPARFQQGIVLANGSLLPVIGVYAIKLCNDVAGTPVCAETSLNVTN